MNEIFRLVNLSCKDTPVISSQIWGSRVVNCKGQMGLKNSYSVLARGHKIMDSSFYVDFLRRNFSRRRSGAVMIAKYDGAKYMNYG